MFIPLLAPLQAVHHLIYSKKIVQIDLSEPMYWLS